MSSNRDHIYATQKAMQEDFVFDKLIARVFPDMINRSVPGYASVIAMTGVLATEYAQADSLCYDLGCSLGATAIAMQGGIQVPGCRVIGVDNSEAMLDRARERINAAKNETPIELVCADIQDIEITDASIVVLNFTFQFIPVAQRSQLLKKIHNGLCPKGILVLSEKITFDDPEEERLQIEMHHAFKRANGYNDLEISGKRSALENVLIPEPLSVHNQWLREAGFSRADVWFQCFNFISLVARK
ncbi:carboxy-S-adenosyl-L-methionine synthase CmoA [Candidatus Vondammii sp. HM_W22]|uniref:carboxy-S-adenosyl-L-methionine synthase CmoA n=1 Tax=Candidatus Vondammii sp. HM_W22 TaxID=2687299 RepID=UPI001F129119|nr:carboxy-S-adenosyl-L-methionine synthase CmoA [Candidatus Vondammii sp. HM_W22]